MQRKRRVFTGDAYSYSHFKMVDPGGHELFLANLTHRVPLQWEAFEMDDRRYLMSIGAYAFADEVLADPLTHQDIDRMLGTLQAFQPSAQDPTKRIPYPLDEARLRRVVDEFGGFFPVLMLGIPPGETFYAGEPYVVFFSDEPGMAQCAVSYLQAKGLPYTFRPNTTGTRARRRYDRMYTEIMCRAYPIMAKEDPATLRGMTLPLIVDFGMRAAMDTDLTGAAILQTWPGTDTMDAVECAQWDFNNGKPTWACSIPASEHAIGSSSPQEAQALDRALQEFKGGFLSWVGDTNGWENGLKLLTHDDRVKVIKLHRGYLVGRPDSGDPIKDVMTGLDAFGKAFGYREQEIGLRKLHFSGLIQGDEMSDRKAFAPDMLYDTMMRGNWCPTNCAVGLGEYNHRGSRSDSSAKFMSSAIGALDDLEALAGYRVNMKKADNPVKSSNPGFIAWFNRDIKRQVPITAAQFRDGQWGDYHVIADYRRTSRRFAPTPRRTFDEIVERSYSSWNERAPFPLPQAIVDANILELKRICMERMTAGMDAPEFPIQVTEFELPARPGQTLVEASS